MTEKYTPTVERLRDDYRRSRVWEAHNGGEIYWEEFERRLKEIQADAWSEGWNAGASWPQDDTNPYRKEQHDE